MVGGGMWLARPIRRWHCGARDGSPSMAPNQSFRDGNRIQEITPEDNQAVVTTRPNRELAAQI